MSSTTRNLLRRQYNCYGDYFDILDFKSSSLLSSSQHTSFTNMSDINQNEKEKEIEKDEEMHKQLLTLRDRRDMNVGTSSSSAREAPQDPDESWLQLSIGPSTSSRPPVVPVSNYYRPPPPPPWGRNQHYFANHPTSLNVGCNVPRFRVATPAGRQHVGVWFHLKAAENQVRMLNLPQIPKSYIRIKDGSMTVRLLMKYLVNKLGLNDDFEVQILCRGQLLLPFLTIRHVRDHIWRTSEVVALLPDSPSNEHVMTLHYNRSP